MNDTVGASDPVAALRRNYRIAFLRYLPRRAEQPLAQAYDLGRVALEGGFSMLDVIRVHHQVLAEVAADTDPAALAAVIDAGADFLTEALGSSDMAQRVVLPAGPDASDHPA